MQGTLLLGTAVTSATAALFAYSGVLTWRKPVPQASRLASQAFALWWWSAAAVIALLSVSNVLGMLGVLSDEVHTTLHYLRAAPLSLALGSLMFYLLFLFTGRKGVLLPVVAAYALHHAFTIYYYVRMGPMHTLVTPWDVRVAPEVPAPVGLSVAFGVLLAVPIVAACLGYVALTFRVGTSEQRYRVGLISLALGQWFLLLLVSFVLGVEQAEWFSMAYQVPGLLSALCVAAALRPPSWLRARLGLPSGA